MSLRSPPIRRACSWAAPAMLTWPIVGIVSSPTSPRASASVPRPVPAAYCFLVRLARSCSRMLPGHGTSHTPTTGSVAPKFSARPGRPDLGAAPTSCSSRAVRFAERVPIPARNTDKPDLDHPDAYALARAAAAQQPLDGMITNRAPSKPWRAPETADVVCSAVGLIALTAPQAGMSAAGTTRGGPVVGAGRRSGSERGGRRRT